MKKPNDTPQAQPTVDAPLSPPEAAEIEAALQTGPPPDLRLAADAAARVEAEIAALSPERYRPHRRPIPQMVLVALATAQRLTPLRDPIAALPGYDATEVDDLALYAKAAWSAHLAALAAGGDVDTLPALADEVAALRTDLLGVLRPLARRGLFVVGQVEAMSRGRSRVEIAGDVARLATMALDAWPRITGRVPFTHAELLTAVGQADALLDAIGLRGETDAPATLRRTAAVTLLQERYGRLRRAVTFVRWDHGDADDFTPPLGRPGPRRRPRAEAGAGDTTETEVPDLADEGSPSEDEAPEPQ